MSFNLFNASFFLRYIRNIITQVNDQSIRNVKAKGFTGHMRPGKTLGSQHTHAGRAGQIGHTEVLKFKHLNIERHLIIFFVVVFICLFL